MVTGVCLFDFHMFDFVYLLCKCLLTVWSLNLRAQALLSVLTVNNGYD